MLDSWARIITGAVISTYLLLSWSALYFGIYYYESVQREREATLRAKALAQEAQMKMLRYQLNPHFLFNTLNAISTLILDNQNKKANHAITRLSEFLRYTLDQDPMKKVTLRQEIEALDLYLGTERLRFGERLHLEYAIEEGALEALVPSLLLQPLLENSLKYAVAAREQGGDVVFQPLDRLDFLVELGVFPLEEFVARFLVVDVAGDDDVAGTPEGERAADEKHHHGDEVVPLAAPALLAMRQ